jgi:hypothetical protein
MALTEGNFTADVRIPAASSYSFSHNQNTGSNRCLIVIVACPAVSTTGVTYGGQAMTNVRNDSTAYSTGWSVWRLLNPPTGVNTVTVTLNTSSFNSTSAVCYSFTDCSGVGNTNFNNTQASNQTTSVTISNNSMVIGACIGGNSTSAFIEIPDNTARTVDWNHNINNFTWGGISPSLSAGTITIQGGATATNIIMAVEVRESAAPAVNNTGGWWLILN